MNIQDLLLLPFGPPSHLPPLDHDPLRENDVLAEADVIDLRFDPLSRTVGILFDLKGALYLTAGNTAVLIGYGVRNLTWSGPTRETTLTAWTVNSSTPIWSADLLEFKFDLWPPPGAIVSLTAESAAFVVGDVPGMDQAQPDYVDYEVTNVPGDDSSPTYRDAYRVDISDLMAGWSSQINLLQASSIGALPQPRSR